VRVAGEPELRPTSERIRETLFNWLASVIEGSVCLDLFAGSGALGFEALSRGAARVQFVERSAPVAAALRNSIDTLGAANADIVEGDALDWLRCAGPQAFDIVFLDPPFADDNYEELCRLLEERHWLATDAQVYLEQNRDQSVPALPQGWQINKEKYAGNVRYSLISTANWGSSR